MKELWMDDVGTIALEATELIQKVQTELMQHFAYFRLTALAKVIVKQFIAAVVKKYHPQEIVVENLALRMTCSTDNLNSN